MLNIGAFDLSRTLEMDPEFLNTDGEHEHDDVQAKGQRYRGRQELCLAPLLAGLIGARDAL